MPPFGATGLPATCLGVPLHKVDRLLADEILEIADDSNRDLIERADGVLTVDHEHIQRARLRVDTRKWILSKMLPKVYGDKFQVGGDGGEPLTFKFIPGDEKL